MNRGSAWSCAGLSAKVKVDSAPTEVFHGIIDSVSSVPSSTGGFSRDLKEYDAVVRLTDELEKINKLRPGLNATVEILVSEREDVLQTPVQSLISVLNKHFVYVLGARGPELKDVKIGETNERTVEILEGLNEGERVIMNPKTQFSKEIGEMEAKLVKEKAHEPQELQAKPEEGRAVPTGGLPKSPGKEEAAPPNPRRRLSGRVGKRSAA